MRPLERFQGVQTREQAGALYEALGAELSETKRDSGWRLEARHVRRSIEAEYGPQGRTSWTKRLHVTIPKPKVVKEYGAVSLVLHDPKTKEVVRVKTLDELPLSEELRVQLLRLLTS